MNQTQFEAVMSASKRVFVPGASGEPQGLLDLLLANPALSQDTTYVQFPIGGMNRTDFASLHPTARMETFFMSPALRSSFGGGRIDFLPMHMRRVFDHIGTAEPFDAVLVHAARDDKGVLRHLYNLDFLSAAMSNTRALVVQLNPSLRPPAGAPELGEHEPDALVEIATLPPELKPAMTDEVAETIGERVAAMVPDGACIQTGIGAIPQAILGALANHNDLGMHGGLIDDAGLALIQRGVISGKNKSIDRGVHITGIAMGSHGLYEALADEPSVCFRPANYTHEVGVIAQHDHFISVNSAIEIDLLGQVSADMVGGRQLSGTGGSVDFMRGAAASKGGISIVALAATAKAGEISRIVSEIAPGSATTSARTDIDRVVTEFGVAELKGRSLDARANALIEIAAPSFRDALRDAWRARRSTF